MEFCGWPVDIFVAHTEYDDECLRRASPAEVLGVTVKVVRPEDLLIHKLIKLRDDKSKILQDAADIDAILSACALEAGYLERWLPTPEAQLLADAKHLDAPSLVARLQVLGK